MTRMILSLDAARLCLDCDILTDSELCPLCDRQQTFPLAVWLVPLQASRDRVRRPRRAGSMVPPSLLRRSAGPPWRSGDQVGERERRGRARWLIVVRANERTLYEHLRRRFDRMDAVEVILDRRQGSARRPQRPSPQDSPGRQRKKLSAGEREWWEIAGFRVICRAEAFGLYELAGTASGRPRRAD
jgi:hypothetical protein